MANQYALQKIQAEIASTSSASQSVSIAQLCTRLASQPVYPLSSVLRRSLFLWLKLTVRERKGDSVDIRIPIPIPLIGLLLRRTLSPGRAVDIATMLQSRDLSDVSAWKELQYQLDSLCGAELLRVDDGEDLVVIGFE